MIIVVSIVFTKGLLYMNQQLPIHQILHPGHGATLEKEEVLGAVFE